MSTNPMHFILTNWNTLIYDVYIPFHSEHNATDAHHKKYH